MNAIEAIAKAKELAIEVFGADAGSVPRLEGIEPNGAVWDVTLSFKRAVPLASGALALNMAPHLVNYTKLLRIDKSNGDLILIKDPEAA